MALKYSDAQKSSTFSGNVFTSMTGIVFIITTPLVVILTLPLWKSYNTTGENLFLLAIPIGWWLFWGIDLYYFRLTDDYLIIRNHFFPWMSRKCRLEDIELASVRVPVYRRAKALRIKKRSGWSWKYSAGSLQKKDWTALAYALRRRGVTVHTGA